MKRLLIFLCFLPLLTFGQYRADRARTNPNVTDGNGYCFRGHTATAVSAYCAEATALFARMTTPPSETRKGQINTLITSLKTAGVWVKADAMYGLAAATEQAALLNWVADTNNATNSGAEFNADSGFKSINATGGHVNTHYNTSQDSVHYGKYHATISLWSLTHDTETLFDFGGGNFSTGSQLRLYNYSSAIIQIHSNEIGFSSGTGESKIHLTTVRKQDSIVVYKNGIRSESFLCTVDAVANRDYFIGAYNYDNGTPANPYCATNRTYAFCFIGGELTTTEVAALHSAVKTYLQAIGLTIP